MNKCGHALETYGMLEGSVIVSNLDPSVNHTHGLRWILEWKLLSLRVDDPEEQFE